MKKTIIITVHKGIDTEKAIESYCIKVNKKKERQKWEIYFLILIKLKL